ncbi:PREDICTED: importin subunit beta-1-like [Acropora digitifera]|uniref:importin subunit beta-1-like n=1 Tax=Acropora digitifera TaxID=70779 RepID=UPI00077A168E|nr:PREDICTED: importin subunit beta-1-like [Acropora digitifera]
MNLTQILEATVSPDQNELQQAQTYLEQAAQENLPQFIVALVNELADGGKSQVARMAAGLQLKNALTSKDPTIRMQHQQRWLTLDEQVKQHVKQMVIQTLGTEKARPAIAPQCIAAIACAEIPNRQWLEVTDLLQTMVVTAGNTDALKEQALESIGYICQDIDPEHLVEQSHKILTAIVSGMRKEEPNIQIRLAATNALLNSLEFSKQNFEREVERNFIMQVVCEATQSNENQLKVAALQNLVKIMSLYYQHMEEYMGRALFPISISAIKSDCDEVSLQGIEFWSSVCDEEMDLAIEAAEAAESNRKPEQTSRFYAKGALQYLTPLLTDSLKRQPHNFFRHFIFILSTYASVLVAYLLAYLCKVPIKNSYQEVMVPFNEIPFFTGSILEGPDPNALKPYAVMAMPMLIKLMKDESVIVRDSVAWTLGRICEILPQVALENYLQPLIETLLDGLDSEPRVAANVCWAFNSLGEAAYDAAPVSEEEEEPQTYCLSVWFSKIVQKLLAVTDRYLLSKFIAPITEQEEEEIRANYIGSRWLSNCHIPCSKYGCHFLQQSVLRKVNPQDALQIANPIMTALLQMLNAGTGVVGGVQEDALMAIGTLVEVVGAEFITYMEAFKPYLIEALRNRAEHQVCIAAVGLVGDIARALGSNILSHSDLFMQILLENLADGSVHRSVKPQILSVFGDIALAIGVNFKNYFEVVIATLNQASITNVDKGDYDMVDYLNDLREGCLEAYTGIIQGLKGDSPEGTVNPDLTLVQPHIMHIIAFIELVSGDQDHSESNVSSACGLVGDICSAFGAQVHPLLEKQAINELLQEGRRSKTHKTKQVATWATKEMRKLKQQQN